MKHTLFLFIISSLLAPCFSYAQATKSIPITKHIGLDTRVPVKMNTSAVERSVQRQLDQARQQAQAQELARRQQQDRETLALDKDDMAKANTNDYVSTPQGDIRKGSWQACEYFYDWNARQQAHSQTLSLEQYQSQRDMVLLMFDISEDYCNVLAQQRRQSQGVSLPDISVKPDFANITLPSLNQTQPIARQPVQTVQPVQDETDWKRSFRHNEFHERAYTPRRIKRDLRQYVEEHCTVIQEALALQAKGEYLRSRHRIALTGYNSLCQAYERTLGQPAEQCIQPASCTQKTMKPKEEEAFLSAYQTAAAADSL